MAFKFVIFAAVLAYANAGFLSSPAVATYAAAPAVAHYSSAPAVSSSYIHQASAPVAVAHAAPLVSAYSAPVAIHAPAVGASQQSVIRSLGGAQAISTYSKAVDSAFSSVRKYDTRITNDALSVAHAPVVSAYAAPVATYAHAAPVATYAHAAPVATYAHAAPVATYAHAAPVATYAHAAPVYAHSAPVVAKTAVAYSPAAVVSHATFSGLGASYQW